MVRKLLRALPVLLCAGSLSAQPLSIDPPNPMPLDTVRLRHTQSDCVNPNSIRLAQTANAITVEVDRAFVVPCPVYAGYYVDYTLGRLPSGDYSVNLIVDPPPGTLGPSLVVGPIHFTVTALPPTGSLHPHDNYTDMWWNPQESGWALNVYQSGDKLIAVWAVYDASSRPTWYALLSGSWTRDVNNALRYAGSVYRTSGPYWGGPYDPAMTTVALVGTAAFQPTATSQAIWSYTIEGVAGTKFIERFRF